MSKAGLQGQVYQDVYIVWVPWVMSGTALLTACISVGFDWALQISLLMRTVPSGF